MSFEAIHIGKANKDTNSKSLISKSSFHRNNISSTGFQDYVLHLQQTLGNQAVQRLADSSNIKGFDFAKIGIWSKPKISQPDDPYETEADRVVEHITNMPVDIVQRKCSSCQMEGEEKRNSYGGQKLPVHIRSQFEPLFGDLSSVRVHPDAPEITKQLHARAVTHGSDIYFYPGQFRPDTVKGKDLIAHELAHTLQTFQSENTTSQITTSVSQSNDSLEKNADALARGQTKHVLVAPANTILRSPFDHETAEARSRRERLLQSISRARDRLIRLLREHGLLQYRSGGPIDRLEIPEIRGGIQGVILQRTWFFSYADREAHIRRIIHSLMEMATIYRSSPIADNFHEPILQNDQQFESSPITHTDVAGSPYTTTFSGRSADWVDLQAAYYRYGITHQLTERDSMIDSPYLDPTNIIEPGTALGAPMLGPSSETTVNLVFPDFDNDPYNYEVLSTHTNVPPGSRIITVRRDPFGYYYTWHGQRIDIPDPYLR